MTCTWHQMFTSSDAAMAFLVIPASRSATARREGCAWATNSASTLVGDAHADVARGYVDMGWTLSPYSTSTATAVIPAAFGVILGSSSSPTGRGPRAPARRYLVGAADRSDPGAATPVIGASRLDDDRVLLHRHGSGRRPGVLQHFYAPAPAVRPS